MKQRKPWLVALLSLCTLFVYTIIWWYKVQKDVKEETNNGIMAVGHLCIMLVPVANIIYYIIWLCKIDKSLVFLGAPKGNRWYAYLFFSLIGMGAFIAFPMIQSKINKIGTVDIKEKTATQVRTDKYAKFLQTNTKK